MPRVALDLSVHPAYEARTGQLHCPVCPERHDTLAAWSQDFLTHQPSEELAAQYAVDLPEVEAAHEDQEDEVVADDRMQLVGGVFFCAVGVSVLLDSFRLPMMISAWPIIGFTVWFAVRIWRARRRGR